MPDDLKVIALKLDQITEVQQASADKLSDVRERLYDPDEGIFARMKDMTSWAEQHEQSDADRHNQIMTWTAEHEKDDDALRKTVTQMADTMKPLVAAHKVHVERKKWTDKIVWLVLSIIITALVPVIWHLVTMDIPAAHSK